MISQYGKKKGIGEMTLGLINKIKLWNIRRRFLSLHNRMQKECNEKKINNINSSWEDRLSENPFSNKTILDSSKNIYKSTNPEILSELILLIELTDKTTNKFLENKAPNDFVYEMM